MVDLTLTRLAGDASSPRLLLVGPSLGTDVETLWGSTVALLDGVEVVGWDLPGHGRSPAATGPFSVADLADVVRARAGELAAGRPTSYAGVSVGGAVGFLLAADPGPVTRVATVASAPRLGTPDSWAERAARVRGAGTSAIVEGSAQRWFADGFLERDPGTGNDLLLRLREVDDESYALTCEALAEYDARPLLGTIGVPLLVVAGEHDPVVGPDETAAAAEAVTGARAEVIAGTAHLPPAEDPAAAAELLIPHLLEETR
ncbi:alpha/beta fold hydrolase [Nocardioides sp. GXQ0305]|uniref:alpha/beta fold hydrolase n=1 Tax=Nocardioides sp. GXQ0305 TaxID=3423912 RepID=UPI003D7CABB1